MIQNHCIDNELCDFVYTVQSETKKKNVAVKTLHAGSADARVRFLREAAIMGQFRHKNVVRMYGVVTATTPVR